MVTKLDRVVLIYLHAIAAPRPAMHDEIGWSALADELDRKRFAVLDTLIKKPRYAGRTGKKEWRAKANPHRPPGL